MSVVFPTTRINLDFEWENDTPIEINYKLARIEGYLEDTEYLMQRSMRILQKDMAHKFETETDPSGMHWDDLVRPEPEQIGILRRGSTNAAMYEAAISDEAWTASPVGVFFDSSVLPDYWIHHEQPDGGSYRIPKREFIAPTQDAEAEIEGMAYAWLDTGVAEIVNESAFFGSSLFGAGGGVIGQLGQTTMLGGVARRVIRDPSTGRFVSTRPEFYS